MRRFASLGLVVLLAPLPAAAQQTGVAATRHNLSVSGPGEVKAKKETEICKFCHIPHNPVVAEPLWGHVLSKVQNYAVPTIRRGPGIFQPAPQPDGASRLCLSCHDGTVALGDIGTRGVQIQMAGSPRLDPGRPTHLGTDLSGHHPISFVVPDGDAGEMDDGRDIGMRPRKAVVADDTVKLDGNGKMQCTTCHDPHSDQNYVRDKVPHFWARSSVDEVCLACHELR